MLKDRIKELCKMRNITIQKLEEELQIGNGVIGRWDKSSPKSDTLSRVADYFGVTTDYLLGRSVATVDSNDPAVVALAQQIKSLPPQVRENLEQQVKLWAKEDNK